MHEELTILGPDPVFDAAFNRLAGTMIQEVQPH
jgi:hypothetical protein